MTIIDRNSDHKKNDKIVNICPAPDVRKLIQIGDEQRLIENAKLIPTRLNLYLTTIEKATELLSADDRGDMMYEDPDVPFCYHSVVIDLDNDEFEGDDIKKLTDILNAFDSIEFIGSSTGDIKIIGIFDGIYEAP